MTTTWSQRSMLDPLRSTTIIDFEYGVVVAGPLALDKYKAVELWAKMRFPRKKLFLDTGGIANALRSGAWRRGREQHWVSEPSLVLGPGPSLEKWRVALDANAREAYPHDPVQAWCSSTQVGLSARYLIDLVVPAGHPATASVPAFPQDAADLQRCVTALDWTQLWDRLDLAAEKDAGWSVWLERIRALRMA